MKKMFYLLFFLPLIFSCENKTISNLPFEVTKDVTCDDLYNNGYRRIFGVDVSLIGKKYDNVEIIYGLEHFRKEWNPEINNEVDFKLDTILSNKYYELYKNDNWLEVPDSIYYNIWGNKEVLRKLDCENSYLFARNYDIILLEKEIRNIRKTIDTTKFKIFDIYYNKESNFEIENFKVINISKKDTFQCSTYKDQKNKYHFTTSIQFREYE